MVPVTFSLALTTRGLPSLSLARLRGASRSRNGLPRIVPVSGGERTELRGSPPPPESELCSSTFQGVFINFDLPVGNVQR